jgi:methyl-accepting chemotaxis protein
MQLNVEIKLLKETQQTRYSISGATVQNMQTNLTALEKSTYLAPEINDIALTEYQKEQLQQIRNRDADEIEADLDEIADGITLLHELAQRMGAEVTHQDKMLTGINGSIDDAHKSTTENVSKVDKMNQKSKKIY